MTEGDISMPGLGRWNDDIRLEMLRSIVGPAYEPTQDDADTLLKTITVLARRLVTRPRSVVPGLGTFEWRKRSKRLPDGTVRKCVSLGFTLARREHDIARKIYRTGKPRAKSALPCIELAVKAATRRGR